MAKDHSVKPGDCFESIAFETGFFSETLWKHPDNAPLREIRESPHVLSPGDVVKVPDLREKQETRPTDEVHKFVRRGVPSRFLLVLENDDEPRAGVSYVLRTEKRRYEGETGDDGVIEHWIDPSARTATLFVSELEQYSFSLAQLEPVSTDTGVAARLVNMGYLKYGTDRDSVDDFTDDQLIAGAKRFCEDQGLAFSGAIDDSVRDALRDAHGS